MNRNSKVSMKQIVKKFKFIFVMHEYSKVMSNDGHVLQGHEIYPNRHRLLPGFTCKQYGNSSLILLSRVPHYNKENY